MKKIKFTNSVTIVANGAFPKSGIPKDILDKSKTIIACDGAANTLDENNHRIDAIIGDLDSRVKSDFCFLIKVGSFKNNSKCNF